MLGATVVRLIGDRLPISLNCSQRRFSSSQSSGPESTEVIFSFSQCTARFATYGATGSDDARRVTYTQDALPRLDTLFCTPSCRLHDVAN
eukprot:6345074-Prymnesium_polylepis.1